jgi:hypothetical protein
MMGVGDRKIRNLSKGSALAGNIGQVRDKAAQKSLKSLKPLTVAQGGSGRVGGILVKAPARRFKASAQSAISLTLKPSTILGINAF